MPRVAVHYIPLTYSTAVEVPIVDKEIFEHPARFPSQKSRNCALWSSWQTHLCDAKRLRVKSRFKRSSEKLGSDVTRPSFQPGGEKFAGRSLKHISLTPQTFFLARGRVFVFFSDNPFLFRREKSTLRLVAVSVFSGNIHPRLRSITSCVFN